ncbi:hypothetical protein SKAU_G00035090, partial [Synaphobranchus kaupii]
VSEDGDQQKRAQPRPAPPRPAPPPPRPALWEPWPSPCRSSWRFGGSREGVEWLWTTTAPTQRRPSPSTTSTRADSNRRTYTWWTHCPMMPQNCLVTPALCARPTPHSRTDSIHMPFGDVFIHAGDFTELGLPSEVKKFNDWLGTLPYEIKIVIAGNHELTFDQEFMADLVKQDFYYFPSSSKLKRESYENVRALLTNCIYLQDSQITVRGLRIYGTPWQPWYYGWGFNLPRGQALLDKWNQIPDDTDILITHCPPLGFLDWVPGKMQRVGCVELLNTVQRRVQPKLHVFGHIHEGYGMMTDGSTTFVNASACTVNFQPMNAPIVFDLQTSRST